MNVYELFFVVLSFDNKPQQYVNRRIAETDYCQYTGEG